MTHALPGVEAPACAPASACSAVVCPADDEAQAAACRRSALLDAADALITQLGPQKTTVADIARAAGVSVGAVYLDFKSKSAILGALANRRLAPVAAAMEAARGGPGSPVDRALATLSARTRALYALRSPGRRPTSDLLTFDCAAVVAASAALETRARDELLVALHAAPTLAPDPAPAVLTEAALRAHAPLLPPTGWALDPAEFEAALAATAWLLQRALAR